MCQDMCECFGHWVLEGSAVHAGPAQQIEGELACQVDGLACAHTGRERVHARMEVRLCTVVQCALIRVSVQKNKGGSGRRVCGGECAVVSVQW